MHKTELCCILGKISIGIVQPPVPYQQKAVRMTQKPDLLITSRMPDFVMRPLEAHFTVAILSDHEDRASFIAQHGKKFHALAASAFDKIMDGAFMAQFPHLSIIANNGVGYDKIDAKAAHAQSIIVTNTPDVLTDEVADTALGLLLNTVRELPQAERYLRAGGWQKKAYPLTASLQGAKLGIVGLGRIGEAIAKRAAAFGLEICYHNRTRKDVPFAYYDTLLGLTEAVDFLLIATPGGADTQKLVDAKILHALGPKGFLINIARGSVVDEDALIEALERGVIAGAGLDVFAQEPHVPQRLLACNNAVLLPHVASASVRTRTAMGQLMIDNLLAFVAGKPPLTPVPETPWQGRYRAPL